MEHEERIRTFIAENTKGGRKAVLTAETRLIEQGILDSMAMFEVIAYLEDTFGIVVDDADLVTENFETTRAIAELVGRKA